MFGAGNEPATAFWRLDALYAAGMLPSSSEFQINALWFGRCADDTRPDVLRGALLYTFFEVDPILGPVVSLVPLVANFGTDKYEHPTADDLIVFKRNALDLVTEELMTGVREPDFSWTGSNSVQTASDFAGGGGSKTYRLRRTIAPTGEPMYMLAATGANTGSHGRCYFNVKAP